jgi:two-component system, NarL family, sensor histidine kinase UhpB
MLIRLAFVVAMLCAALTATAAPVQEITSAVAVNAIAQRFPAEVPAAAVELPDDWSTSRPRHDGSVWYRVNFDHVPEDEPNALTALYIRRVCSNAEVLLNGHIVFSGGRMSEPVTRNCYFPQLVTLPPVLLRPTGNVLDIHVNGHALHRVAARQRAGGLSELKIGPQRELSDLYETQMLWSVTAVKIVSLVLAVLGMLMLSLAWLHRREAFLGYFGALSLVLLALSLRVWWRDIPLDNAWVEWAICCGFGLATALVVQFLISYAGLRSRIIEGALMGQSVLLPLSLLAAGSSRLFFTSSLWYGLLMMEGIAATGLYLTMSWKNRRRDFWPMAGILGACALVVVYEIAVQFGVFGQPQVHLLLLTLPMLFIAVAARMLQVFAEALHAAEAGRSTLEGRVAEITAEIERNFAQLAELRVEQVTEKERKRIAGDLHDDLGAKLLTIVHTSESERISTLAREALEEMRLSVRGLTGKPVRLADALADWRAEVVSRLGQANIEIDWRGPSDETDQLLPARGYVQTTRILREAVSNIIKHSGASHCKVRCAVHETQFGLNIQDNGKGIPMELDGKLDRGHGMSSMKHRAKQMQGQCLVESGPGYGTVIRLTLPL